MHVGYKCSIISVYVQKSTTTTFTHVLDENFYKRQVNLYKIAKRHKEYDTFFCTLHNGYRKTILLLISCKSTIEVLP